MDSGEIWNGRDYAVRLYGGRTSAPKRATVAHKLGKLTGTKVYGFNQSLRDRVTGLVGEAPAWVKVREGGQHFIVKAEHDGRHYVVTSRHFVSTWAAHEQVHRVQEETRQEMHRQATQTQEEAAAVVANLQGLLGLGETDVRFRPGYGVCLSLTAAEALTEAVLEAVA